MWTEVPGWDIVKVKYSKSYSTVIEINVLCSMVKNKGPQPFNFPLPHNLTSIVPPPLPWYKVTQEITTMTLHVSPQEDASIHRVGTLGLEHYFVNGCHFSKKKNFLNHFCFLILF
jgi:hypothetical protein